MRIVIAATTVFFVICAPAGHAAPAVDSPADEPEAVITVRGERESDFDAPAAVSILTARDINARAINTLDAAVIAAPGLHMINDQDPGTNIVSLRGVSSDRLQQAAIAYLADGVALADTELFTGRLYDIARIEVLKGPQGALLGKNAAGGALQVITRDPSVEEGFLTLSAGNGAWRSAQGAVSFSLPSNWRARASGLWSAADGWIKNRTLDRIVDAEESRNLRLRAAGPLGSVATDLKFQWMADGGGAAWASSNNVTGIAGGELKGRVLTDPIGDFEGRSSRRWLQASARFSFSLAGGEVIALLASDDYEKRWVEELDYRPGPLTFFGLPLFPQGLQPIAQPTDVDAATTELRWSRTFDRGEGATAFRLSLGVFAQDIERKRVDDFGPLLFGAPAPAYDTDSLQTALFSGLQATRGNWSGEVQLRADRDDRVQTITSAGVRIDSRAAVFDQLQPRVAISYMSGSDLHVYAVYGEGFRTGGFNPLPNPTSIWRARFEPEITRSLETGVKARGGGWRLEAAAFVSRIDAYQNYTFLDGNSVTLSVDAVDVRGFEFFGQRRWRLRPPSELVMSVGYALADARIDRFVAPDPLIAGRTRDYSGNRTPNAPDWTATASLDWRTRIGLGVAGLRVDVNATGETSFEIDNQLRAPSKAWIDLSADYELGNWAARVWVKNAADDRWAISAFGQTMLPLLAGLGPDGPFDTFTINRGRQWAAELTRRF